MNTNQSNVLIHVNAVTGIDPTAALQGSLSQVHGVIGVRPSARPRLTWVDYDPSLTGCRDILSHMQQRGLHTQLVGM